MKVQWQVTRAWAVRGSVPSILGGLAGAWLLLRTPASVFDWLVPWLIAFATALFALSGLSALVFALVIVLSSAALTVATFLWYYRLIGVTLFLASIDRLL